MSGLARINVLHPPEDSRNTLLGDKHGRGRVRAGSNQLTAVVTARPLVHCCMPHDSADAAAGGFECWSENPLLLKLLRQAHRFHVHKCENCRVGRVFDEKFV